MLGWLQLGVQWIDGVEMQAGEGVEARLVLHHPAGVYLVQSATSSLIDGGVLLLLRLGREKEGISGRSGGLLKASMQFCSYTAEQALPARFFCKSDA